MPRESKKSAARLSSKDQNPRTDTSNQSPSSQSSTAPKDLPSDTPKDHGQQQPANDFPEANGTSNLNIPAATTNGTLLDQDGGSWNPRFSTSPAASSGSPPYHVQTIPRFSSHYDQRWPLPADTDSPVKDFRSPAYNLLHGAQQRGYVPETHWSSNTTPESSPPDLFSRQRGPQSLSPPSHWPRSPPRQFASMAWAGNSATDLHGTVQNSGQISLSPPSQAHFNSLADRHPLRPASSRDKDVAGSHASFYAFDTLQAANVRQAAAVENVLVIGSTGRLDVYGVQLRKIHPIGRLEGLRGTVLRAKILPSTSGRDPISHLRPLVALVIHGPHLNGSSYPHSQGDSGPRGDEIAKQQNIADLNPSNIPWQTTVEVYSLKSSAHVTTLFKSSPEAPPNNFVHPVSHDDLRLDAEGQFLVITSGKSGEIFVFTPRVETSSTNTEPFECVGKVWTSVHQYYHGSRPNTGAGNDFNRLADPDEPSVSIPLYSLSQRWLAYVPPSSSSKHAIDGVVCCDQQEVNIPGLKSFTPPASPIPNCAVDIPAGDSLISQIARGVTQELIKGASWVGAHGMQAWRNYWNSNLQQQQAESLSNTIPWERNMDSRFPPTHADPSLVSPPAETGCVSLLDLASLSIARKVTSKSVQDPIPFATFLAPLSCSFVSLSPSGLLLLTVSRDGDIQQVWDLMRTRPQRDDIMKGAHQELNNLKVRQVAKFSRLTNAKVVDVVWSEPRGNNIAILTAKGTAHVFNLPSAAFQWPPPTPFAPLKGASSSANGQVTNLDTDTAYQSTQLPLRRPSGVSSAVQSLSHKAQPLVAAVRNRTTSSSSDNGSATSTSGQHGAFSNSYISAAAAGGAKGGKAVVSGVAKSISAAAGTVGQLRSPEEARFRLSLVSSESGLEIANGGAVRFLTGHERGHFGAISSNKLSLYVLNGQYQKSSSLQATSSSRSRTKNQQKEFSINLPRIPYPVWSPATIATGQQIISGFWSLGTNYPSFNSVPEIESKISLHPLSFAELETCSPFQPIYADRRVTLSTFAEELPDLEEISTKKAASGEPPIKPSSGNDSSRSRRNFSRPAPSSRGSGDNPEGSKIWVFGRDIALVKVDVGLTASNYSSSLHRAEDFLSSTSGGIETIRLKKSSGDNTETWKQEKPEAETDMGPQEFFEQDCTLLELEE